MTAPPPTATLLDLAREAVISARGCMEHPCGDVALRAAAKVCRAAVAADAAAVRGNRAALRCLSSIELLWYFVARQEPGQAAPRAARDVLRRASDALRAWEAGETL